MSASEDDAPRVAAEPATLALRLVAMVYDAIPLLPILLLVSTLALLLNGGEPVTAPAARLGLLAATWLAIGAYFVVSWRRGGATMGMRPWRLQVRDRDGRIATTSALWARYALATVSLGAAGLGFLWSLFDGDRRTWHDLGSGTVLLRVAG